MRAALEEIGSLDVFGLIVGQIFFKMAGLLLPIVYTIMTANNLIAGQVDSGSMAYVLSTPTRRRQVTATQMCFLVLSLFVMFALTCITGLVSLAALKGAASVTITYGEMALLCLGAFVTMLAVAGICFLASVWFDRSKQAMTWGGGLSMFFLVAAILGLFGSPAHAGRDPHRRDELLQLPHRHQPVRLHFRSLRLAHVAVEAGDSPRRIYRGVRRVRHSL